MAESEVPTMQPEPSGLLTPIYHKTSADMPWPKDAVFFLLAANGLFLCRNHPLFRSCVPARRWPGELAPQQEGLTPQFPKVPQTIVEAAVGFFARVAELHQAEAAALLTWDKASGAVRLFIPQQRCTVEETSRGDRYPLGVRYDLPTRLPDGVILLGDIHSHPDMSAFASHTDCADEDYRAGLHIVVGRLDREPPQFHAEAAVDGIRFRLDPAQVLGGYARRRQAVPQNWLERVTIKLLPPIKWPPLASAKPANSYAALRK
jgi:PRTRC genetic system protein A